MVCTVGAARRFGGKKAVARSSASFAIGLLAGSMLVFGSLGVVATLLHPGRAWILAAAAVAAAAALSDAAGLRVRPQIPLQVPEHWRRTMPLPSALFMYGLLIGTGLTTYVPAAAAWALMVLSLALGKLVPALAVGVLLAAGRALPVLALIFRSNSETEPGAIGALGERPGILRLVRVFCAVSLAAGTAAAVAGTVGARVIVPSAEDPSVAATDLAWQQPGLGGFLSRPGAAPLRLPGNDPAIGGSLVAWHVASLVTVADRATLMPVVQETAAGVQKLALSEHSARLPARPGRWRHSARRPVAARSGGRPDGCLGSLAVHARPTVPLRQHRGLPRRDATRELDLGRRSGHRKAPAPSWGQPRPTAQPITARITAALCQDLTLRPAASPRRRSRGHRPRAVFSPPARGPRPWTRARSHEPRRASPLPRPSPTDDDDSLDDCSHESLRLRNDAPPDALGRYDAHAPADRAQVARQRKSRFDSMSNSIAKSRNWIPEISSSATSTDRRRRDPVAEDAQHRLGDPQARPRT